MFDLSSERLRGVSGGGSKNEQVLSEYMAYSSGKRKVRTQAAVLSLKPSSIQFLLLSSCFHLFVYKNDATGLDILSFSHPVFWRVK